MTDFRAAKSCNRLRNRDAAYCGECICKLQIRKLVGLSERLHDRCLELERRSCGDDHGSGRIAGLLPVFPVNRRGNCRVRIDDVAVLLVALPDFLRSLFLVSIAACKIAESFAHLVGDLIFSLLGKLLHKAGIRLGTVACDVVDQALQIGGNQDIHRRRGGQNELAVAVILAGPEEIIQNLVGVGGADQPVNRNAELLRIVGGKDVAEISGGNDKIHGFARGNGFRCRNAAVYRNVLLLILCGTEKSRVSPDVVSNLRNEAADVDGVCGGELVACCGKLLLLCGIRENLLDAALGIVEVAADSDNAGIFPLLRYHLALLNRRDTVLRIENNDLRARNIRKACQRSLSGVARGGRQNDDLLVLMVLLRRRDHQVRQNRERHVLKGNGGAMEKLHVFHAVYVSERSDGRRIKLAVIRCGDAALQLFFRIIGKKQLHDFIGNLTVGHSGELLQRDIQLRKLCGNEQSAVIREALQNCLRCRNRCALTSGAAVHDAHNLPPLPRPSRGLLCHYLHYLILNPSAFPLPPRQEPPGAACHLRYSGQPPDLLLPFRSAPGTAGRPDQGIRW